MLDKILRMFILFMLLLTGVFVFLGLGSGEHEIVTEVEINAPVEKVFAYVRDGDNMSDWLAGFVSSELKEGKEGEKGSEYELVFEENGKEIVMMETITEVVPDKQFSFDLKNSAVESHVDMFFNYDDGITTFKEVDRFTALGFSTKVGIRLFKGSMKKERQQMYDQLKTILEE